MKAENNAHDCIVKTDLFDARRKMAANESVLNAVSLNRQSCGNTVSFSHFDLVLPSVYIFFAVN